MNRKGQALVEFVLILPIFIMILFSIVDFGMIFNKKNELENYQGRLGDFRSKTSYRKRDSLARGTFYGFC